MGKLQSLVDFFVEESVKDSKSQKDKELLKQALTNDVMAEMKAQMTEMEKASQKETLRKAEEAERAKLKQGRIATFILDALFLAFCVGLIVNQTTNLIEKIRAGMGWSTVALSILLIIVLAIIITWFLLAQMGIRLKSEEDANGG